MQASVFNHQRGVKLSLAKVRKLVEGMLAATGCAGQALHVTFVNDQEMQEINRETFGKDRPTNVISFPLGGIPGDEQALLGDVIVSTDTALREAEAAGLSADVRLAQLIIHGFVHLLGYEHVDVSPAERRRMRRKEQKVYDEVAERVNGLVRENRETI